MRRLTYWLAALLVVAAPTVAGAIDRPEPAAVYVVARGGSDAGPGSNVRPFATLGRAQRAARVAALEGRAVTVVVRGGTYRLAAPVVLRRADSGRPGAPVTYRAYPGEHPVISGGRVIAGWRRTPDGAWTARAPGLRTRELYVNGRRARRARGTLPPGTVETATGYRLPDDASARCVPSVGAEFVYRTKWTQHRGAVAAVHGRDVRMVEPWWPNAHLLASAPVDGLPSWIENARCLVDGPGEWYLDRRTGTLVYRPRPGEGLASARVVAPTLSHLLTVRGSPRAPVHDVRITGLTFAHATWLAPDGPDGVAAVQAGFRLVGRNTRFVDPSDRWQKMPAAIAVHGAERIHLDHLVVEHVAADGVDIARSSTAVSVTSSLLRDIGGNAITVGDIDDHHPRAPALPVSEIRIEDDIVQGAGAEYEGAVGIWAGYPRRLTVAHNLLRRLPYTGISIGWGWGARDWPNNPTAAGDNRVAANEIDDVMRVLQDGGGVYVAGSQPGLEITGNAIHGVHAPYGALYLDSGTRHANVRRNLVYDAGTWIALVKGADNSVTGNYWDRDPSLPGNTVIASAAQAPADIVRAAGPRAAALRAWPLRRGG